MANTKVTQELIADDAIGSDQLASSVSVAGSARIAQVAITSSSNAVAWDSVSAAKCILCNHRKYDFFQHQVML